MRFFHAISALGIIIVLATGFTKHKEKRITGIAPRTFICLHSSLSKAYDFEVKVTRYPNNFLDSCVIRVKPIVKKTRQQLDEIEIISTYLFSDAFTNCGASRSYSTGVNSDDFAEDNDYGDFIVVDINFDGKEDFVVKKSSGGNGGPEYDYYLQKENRKFTRDSFLSDSMRFFPNAFNSSGRQLTTVVHASAGYYGQITYEFDSDSLGWKMVGHELIANDFQN